MSLDTPAASSIALGYRIVSGLGTAIEGTDVRDPFVSSVLRFDPGDQIGEFTLRAIGDLDAENDESFVVELYKISGNVTFPDGGPVDRAVGWILDNDGDPSPNATYVLGPVVTEGNAGTRQADFEISLSRPVSNAANIGYATFAQSAAVGSDFVGEAGTVGLIQGERTATVSIGVIGDVRQEFDETMGVQFTNPPPAAGTVALGGLTILDDDQPGPSLRLTASTLSEPDSSENSHAFFLTLSRPSTVDVTVSYRLLSGSAQDAIDVRLPFGSGTVTIPAGQTVVELYALRTLGDLTPEADESYLIEGTVVSGNALFEGRERVARALGWILDDDGAANPLAIDVAGTTVIEGDAVAKTITITVELSRPAPQALTVNYATRNGTGANGARAGDDFIGASGQLLFRAGQSDASFTLNILGNRVNEANETFSLVLTPQSAINGRLSSTVTIIDNDPGPTPLADQLGDPNATQPLFIDGLAGNDVIRGGIANDTLEGNVGNDILFGREGNDRMFGQGGNDRMFGDTGADLLNGGSGRNQLSGEGGDDTLVGGNSVDALDGGSGKDVLDGKSGNDNLAGGGGRDNIAGGGGGERLAGGSDNDRLDGGGGGDTVIGGSGDDRIGGGGGNDVLSGQRGADVFVFARGFGRDTVRDFELRGGGERIDVSDIRAIRNFRDLAQNHLDDQRGDAIIDDGDGNMIRLVGIAADDLSSSNFLF